MNIQRVPIQLHNNVIASLRHYISIANQFFNQVFDEPELIYRKKAALPVAHYYKMANSTQPKYVT